MKNYFYLILLCLLIISCSSPNDQIEKNNFPEDYPQKWQFDRAITSNPNQFIIEEDEIKTFEQYIFLENKNFMKIRDSIEAGGYYEVIRNQNDSIYLQLNYTEYSPIIDNCIANSLEEKLYFNKYSNKLEINYISCDYSLKEYKLL